MKKIITTAFATMLAVYGYSQTYLPLSGGTLTGPVTIADPSTTTILNLNSSSSSYQSTIYLKEGGVNKFEFGKLSTTPDFYIYNYGVSDYSMRISHSNNSIAFSGPLTGTAATFNGNVTAARLDINGKNAVSSDTYLRLNQYGDYANGVYTPYNFKVDGALTGVSASFNGNVGIGTTGSYKFQVQAAGTDASALELVSAFRKSSSGGGEIALRVHDSLVDILSTYETSANNVDMSFTTTKSDASQPERMRIQASTGNVGIGTTTPDEKLTVAGKIHSQEVKVTIDAGADFVFNKDYNLKPLSEVGDYISANKHLPEIASAKEMEKNGLELGQMNIKLLQKIEELTLYMIEKDKQVKDLQSRLEKIEKNRH